jgi:hypothetical protein
MVWVFSCPNTRSFWRIKKSKKAEQLEKKDFVKGTGLRTRVLFFIKSDANLVLVPALSKVFFFRLTFGHFWHPFQARNGYKTYSLDL